MKEIKLIKGGVAVDDRGSIRFVNDFNPTAYNILRTYWISNHIIGFVRAWHGHRLEQKGICVVSGSAIVGAVNMETEEVFRYVLSAENPGVLWIPKNYYNGFMPLEENTILMVYSTATLEESMNDDIRQPFDKWNIWDVTPR